MKTALRFAPAALELLALAIILAIAFRLASDLEACEFANAGKSCQLTVTLKP